MSEDSDYNKSVSNWRLEQEVLISTIQLNIDYLEKEIELKQKQLQLYKESIVHEIDFLDKYKDK